MEVQLNNLPEKDVPHVIHPEDNAYSDIRFELGKMLFYDNRLSADESISCASCHKQEFAFGDNGSVTSGVFNRPGTRNVPSIVNVGFQPYLTREGGVPTLEMQVLVPIQEHNEFGSNIVDIASVLSTDSLYQSLSQAAYGRGMDAFVITRAISVFERSITGFQSNFDLFYYDHKLELDDSELEGYKLFYGTKAKCSNCHGGVHFTDFTFQNNGLYTVYQDSGRYRLTGRDQDIAVFKVPSLRNIARTAPYMHDGSIATLEDVIEHYSSGIENHLNKNEELESLHLTSKEKRDLLSFLYTLTDNKLINNEKYNN